MLLQQGGNPQAGLPLFLGGMLVFLCLILVVALVVAIFFLLTLSRTLAKCDPRNRTMEPGLVWLNFIPCFNIVWQFVTVIRVAESLKNEFESRGVHRDDSYGRTLGLTWLILNLVGSVISNAGSVLTNPAVAGNQPGQGPMMAGLGLTAFSLIISLVTLVLFIVYWVKIAGYSRELDETSGGYDDHARDNRYRYDEDDR